MSYLQLNGVEKYYGDFHAIKGIDLSINKGEFVVFVGPSGCGKSTLLRMIAGLEDIDAGELVLEGNTITDTAPSKRDLAMVFQSYALYPHMTVEENMSFALRIQKENPTVIAEKVQKAAAKLNLTDHLKRTPKELSGGQRQRVAIGRAIVRSPKVFLFDEPLSNLDAALRGQTRVEIAHLHRELDATSIYVTHDQVEAMTLADRVVVLQAGVIEQVGTPMELYDAPTNKFVAQFIGMPQMNILPYEGGMEVPTGTVEIGIRPEHLSTTDYANGQWRGQVEMVEALGNETLIHVNIENAAKSQIIVRQYERTLAKPGDLVGINLNILKLHCFDDSGTALR